MSWLKLKFAVGVGVAAILAGGAAIVTRTEQNRVAEFEVAGFITRVAPTGESSYWGNFSAIVSGKKSLIAFRFFNGESFVCGTDGEDHYRLNEMLPTRQKNPSNPQFGEIWEGSFPKKASAAEQLVWLAYASSPFHIEKDFKLPMESIDGIGSYMTSETTTIESPPHLPSLIQWWAPNFWIVGNTDRVYMVNYPEGYFAFEFKTMSQTKFMGMSLPQRFSFTYFTHKSHERASTLEIAKRMRTKLTKVFRREDVVMGEMLICNLTNLTKMSYKGNFLPALDTNVSIVDWRFEREVGFGIHSPVKRFTKKGDALVDVTSEVRWPQRSDPELIESVRANMQAKEGIILSR